VRNVRRRVRILPLQRRREGVPVPGVPGRDVSTVAGALADRLVVVVKLL